MTNFTSASEFQNENEPVLGEENSLSGDVEFLPCAKLNERGLGTISSSLYVVTVTVEA